MKQIIITLIAWTAIVLNASATAQNPEVLMWNGQKYNLMAEPLLGCEEMDSLLGEWGSEWEATSSWRNYRGYWEIVDSVDNARFRQIAINMAIYHHERVDGTGYPEKLKGDEIPLEARILAIADVYDALASKRAYKEQMSAEEVYNIMLKGKGTQFDSYLFEHFENARPEIEAYYASLF